MSFFNRLDNQQRQRLFGMGNAILGSVMFAFGLNVFITPLSLYNGGFMGISQLIRTLIVHVFHFSFGQTDIAGIIYFLINIPLIYMAWSKMGKEFFARSIITGRKNTMDEKNSSEERIYQFCCVKNRSLLYDRWHCICCC